MGTDHVTRVGFCAEERLLGQPSPHTLAVAASTIRDSGVVVLDDLFAPEFINALHDSFVKDNSRYFVDDLHDDALHVGNKRMVLPVEIAGIYNQPYLYGNTLFYSLLQELLGSDFIMGGFGAIISLPGSEAQPIHRDHPLLFHDMESGVATPIFAITMAIPLVEMNDSTGTTRFYPGTHKLEDTSLPKSGNIDPVIPIGSCALWDYRIMHGGLPNVSDNVRPMMYFSFCRSWFRDAENFKHYSPVNLNDEEYSKIPMAYHHMFDWIRPPVVIDLSRYQPDALCPCYSGKAIKDCHGRKEKWV